MLSQAMLETQGDDDDEVLSQAMLETQGFDDGDDDDNDDGGGDQAAAAAAPQAEPADEPDGEPSEQEMLAAIFERFDADCDGYLSFAEAQAWGRALTGNDMGADMFRSIVEASLPPGASQQEEDEVAAAVARGISADGLRRVYATEESLDVPESYARILESVPHPPNLNLKFYKNLVPFHGGVTIEEFFATWAGDYARLERAHNYIQWLFPSPEASMFNQHAQPLLEAEAAVMRADPEVQQRLRQSVELFLDFLG